MSIQITKRINKIALVLVLSVCSLHINAQGPGSPEAAGFEPVDASDMVSLSTGDLSYNLPLLEIDGFPVNLSYHAGITNDLEASWVGLGWYLNPGAINRSLANTPDDWKNGVGIDFTSYYNSEVFFGVTIDVGFANSAQVGVGLNWGAGKGMSGSVRASLGFNVGDVVNAGVSVSANTNGDVSVGVSAGVSVGSLGAGASYSYSVTGKKGSVGLNAGTSVGGGNFAGVGASFDSNGMSIGASISNQSGVSNSASASSFSSGDMNIEQQTQAFAIPIYIGPISLTLGFSRTKVEYSLRKGFYKNGWGALYANDFVNLTSDVSAAGSRDDFTDYQKRTKTFDTYSTRLPQAEEEFIADYSKDIENINFTYMGYDGYQVNAQGLSGSMKPRLLQNITIFGEGNRTQNAQGDDIHVFWHHGDNNQNNVSQRQFGTDNSDDLHFYFEGQLTSRETVIPSVENNGTTKTSINSFVQGGGLDLTKSFTNNNVSNRAKSPNFIEVFTNKQIESGYAQSRGLITPSSISNSDRIDIAKFDPDGIGAYKITSADGKTYHFSLPVYHYEQIQRNLIESNENPFGTASNVQEKRQYSKYATHWLLTSVTGSDYLDKNGNNTPDVDDYGYWVELEYGKWSDGYVWRTPYESGVKNYNTNLTNDIEEKDKGYYQFGRKQLYYLDQIKTRNQTAVFIKDIRYDAVGKELSYALNGNGYDASGRILTTGGNSGMNFTPDVHIREGSVQYKREYNLKLNKIALFKTEVAEQLAKNSHGSLGINLPNSVNYVRDDDNYPNWESPDYHGVYGTNYSYSIHNESAIFDVNDVPEQFITDNALRVIEFDTDYSLAKNSPSSSELPANLTNNTQGRLTLNGVKFKGRNAYEYTPPYQFDYYLENMENISLASIQQNTDPNGSDPINYVLAKRTMVDNWGFLKGIDAQTGEDKIKAWSLKEITTPTGGKIQIDYEEDDYWIEAFARRYWTEGLQFTIDNLTNDTFDITIKQNSDEAAVLDTFDFTEYFTTERIAFFDLWLAVWDRDAFSSTDREIIDILKQGLVPYSITQDEVVFKVARSYIKELDDAGDLIPHTFRKTSGNGSEHPNCITFRGDWGNGGDNCNDGFNLIYRLLANKVPENEVGGGLRVKQLITKDGINEYKTTYDYNHPFKNRSSGITSYAPVDGLKFVPYQSELPAPGVTYEYVTMRETNAEEEYDSETRYRHHVLQPVFDIFDPNIHMEALNADAEGEDQIFWASVQENFGGIDGSTANKKTAAKKIDINVNTALIGQIKSIENLNSKGQLLLKTENEYINGRNLADLEPNKGHISESFNSMKTIFKTNEEGTVVDDSKTKRLLSISTKTEYNNMLKKVITYSGNQKVFTSYSDVDPFLGGFRTSETTLADGTEKKEIRVPAYQNYSEMGSKVLDPSNRNMLTQEAINISSVKINNLWKTTTANVTTWNNQWTYRDNTGIEMTPAASSEQIWRKHESFVWKDAVDQNGTFGQELTANDFNWGLGATQTNTQWQKISEITRYTHWSTPVETQDINGNYASSKMADNFTKTIAGGNASYTEMFYSGVEYADDDWEAEINIGPSSRVTSKAHTGKYSSGAQYQSFTFITTLKANEHRAGNYKISVWADKEGYENARIVVGGFQSSPKEFNGEKVFAGDWVQLNHYEDLSAGLEEIRLTSAVGEVYYDDFRLHPVYVSMNSYVYDHDTDQLTHILDANNMATEFRYDDAGRLCKTYKEVFDTDAFVGGFKMTNQYKYNYKNVPVTSCQCCDDEVIDFKPIAMDDNAATTQGNAITINVTGNDNFGGDGPSSSPISIVSQPTNGVATVDDLGSVNDPTNDIITYIPSGTYVGIDTFSYQICDADGDCSIATVTVDVTGLPPITATSLLREFHIGDPNHSFTGYVTGVSGGSGSYNYRFEYNIRENISDPNNTYIQFQFGSLNAYTYSYLANENQNADCNSIIRFRCVVSDQNDSNNTFTIYNNNSSNNFAVMTCDQI